MKVFITTLAALCLAQAIAGQVASGEHKLEQPNQTELNNKPEHHVAGQPCNSAQHVGEHVKSKDKVQTIPAHSVEIPSKVQHVVTQVSQHIPQVVTQHVASQKRMERSVKARLTWQDMQVNAVEQPDKCQFICHQLDVTVCGYNGQCYWEFESQCDLATYNCLNTKKIFHVVDSGKCKDISAAHCQRGDM